MPNENITKEIVRRHFREEAEKAIGDDGREKLIVEEDISSHPDVARLLDGASKKGGNGRGMPDFIIRHSDYPSFIIVIECKADVKFHESVTGTGYIKYAVDGALHYASFIAKGFDVLAIGVSGQSEDELKVTHFIGYKSKEKANKIFGNYLLSIDSYIGGYTKDEKTKNQNYERLLDYSKELNLLLHSLKVREDKRSLLLSGVLIALSNNTFTKTYHHYDDAEDLSRFLFDRIRMQLNSFGDLYRSFEFLTEQPKLNENRSDGRLILREIIRDIDSEVNGFARTYEYYDIIGQFYVEFLRYSNSEKGLGIVLTPPHITDLFTDIAKLSSNDIVFDNCSGTGGFLVSAMKRMIEAASGDETKEQQIKQSQLLGIEFQPEIYPLSASNMFLHGDGKSNIVRGDCFGTPVPLKTSGRSPNIGFLNPPYKKEKNDIEELEFVLNNLDALRLGGTCVAIVPMRCVLATKGDGLVLKERLMQKHRLLAVFSMPDQLFHNSKVGVVTAIIVFQAGYQHNPNTDSTFFGYFKDDGFQIRKPRGRYDYLDKWKAIKKEWLNLYFSRKEKAGFSVIRNVGPSDEWCAEAYMDTDYTALSDADFEKAVLEYSSFLHRNHLLDEGV